MEEKIQGEESEEQTRESGAEETPLKSPEDESEEESEEDESEEESEDVDHKKTLEELEGKEKPNKLEKAKRALFFTAKGVEELGGDPLEVLGLKEKKGDGDDLDTKIEKKFKEQEVKRLARTEDEFKVIMWYVTNQNLSVEDAHILANKGRLKSFASEVKRSDVIPPKGGTSSRKARTEDVPKRADEEVEVLRRRGLVFNTKTNTYQGKYTEEYWDGEKWQSRMR